MTMSGHNPEPSAPLDLRTKTRECGGCSERTAGKQGDPVRAERTPLHSPKVHMGNGGHRENHVQAITPCQCYTLRDCNLKTSDRSRLPLRKRPFRPDHSSTGASGGSVEETRRNDSKTESRVSSSSAKITKCSLRNGMNAEPHRTLASPAAVGPHSVIGVDQQQVFPSYYYMPTYCSSPCTRVQTPLHIFEDADCPLSEVALATHQDEDGDTALHIAVAQEKEAVVYRLIHILRWARKDVDLYNNLRQTPLHLAVITHQPGVVQVLLQAGADPGALDRNGQTAVHLCCEHSQDSCLSVILSHLSRGPCCPSGFLDIRNYEGLTPLHLAVQDGNMKLAKMLLESGADINAVDNKSGSSPLVHAVENTHMKMVNFLIENGCNVNSQSYSGNTALHIACGRGEVEAVRVLLKNGADSSLKNYHNDTAVMVAKNKKVSDVLRGKSTRCHSLKTHSFNGSPSPNNSSQSPLTIANHQRNVSLSPVAPHTHSPRSQSGESMSGNQSPVETQETENLPVRPRTFHNIADNRMDYEMSINNFHFFTASHFEPLISTVRPICMESRRSGHVPYYSAGVQRPLYPSDTQLIIFPASYGRSGPPVSSGPPLQSIATESRPSSHNSDQSDISNTSVSSDGKGIS